MNRRNVFAGSDWLLAAVVGVLLWVGTTVAVGQQLPSQQTTGSAAAPAEAGTTTSPGGEGDPSAKPEGVASSAESAPTSGSAEWTAQTRLYKIARIEIPANSVHRNNDKINMPPSLYVVIRKNGSLIGEESEDMRGWSVEYSDEARNSWEIAGNESDSYVIELWDDQWTVDNQILTIANLHASDFSKPIVEQVQGAQKGVVFTFKEIPMASDGEERDE